MRETYKIDLRDYQLFVFDIDGTLCGQDHRIMPTTRKTLFRLRDAGYRFTLATGKSLPGTIAQADILEIDLPMVLINGAILQKRNGDVLYADTLPESIVYRVIAMCEQRGSDLVMYAGELIYFKKMNANIAPVYGHLTMGMHAVHEWDTISERLNTINKCLVVDTTSPKNLIEIGKEFENTFEDTVDVLHTSAVLVEVMPKGINKLKGIKQLADRLDIPLSSVMSFGDYDNDVEMLAGTGLGVAVGNASKRAKTAADLIIGSVDEQGPARFLADLLDRLSES